MRTSKEATSKRGSKRTLGECAAMIGAEARRLILEGVSARAQAIIGTQPHKKGR